MKTKEKLFDELIETLKKTGKDFSYQFVVRHADKSSYTREDYEWLLPLMYEENKKSNPNCTFEEYLQEWIDYFTQEYNKKLEFLEYEKRLNLDELYNKFFEDYDIFTTLSKINNFYRENKKEAEKQKDEDLVKAHTRAWARAKRKEKEFLSKGSKSEKESAGITGPIYDDDSNPTYILPSGKEIKESELKKSQK